MVTAYEGGKMMSNRKQLLKILERFISSVSNIPTELEQQLDKAKEKLEQITDEQFEQISDHVFSSPAHEHQLDDTDPYFAIQSLYGEMERVAREERENREAIAAIKELQHFYGITDKDGYFP